MPTRKYEVHGTDGNLDLWIVATDNRDTAEAIERQFTDAGYTDVTIVETK